MRIEISILLVFIVFSCKYQESKSVNSFQRVEYVNVMRNGKATEMLWHQKFDSISNKEYTKLAVYFDTIILGEEFVFKFTDSDQNNDKVNPISPYQFKGSQKIIVNGKRFTIEKYYYDDEMTTDDATNYFYVPKIGIVLGYSITWENYWVMINHPEFSKAEIYYLGSWVLMNEDFLKD